MDAKAVDKIGKTEAKLTSKLDLAAPCGAVSTRSRNIWVFVTLSLALGTLGAAGPARAAGIAPHISGLLGRARLVVAADIRAVTRYDNGRATVAALRIERVLKGSPPGREISVVEMRDFPGAAPTFSTGNHIVAFLRRAPTNSYLRTTLPGGSYFSAVGGGRGVLSTASGEQAAAMTRLVARVLAVHRKPEPDPAKRTASRRALIFDLLAARPPQIVRDGAASLEAVSGLAKTLTATEREVIEQALAREDLPRGVRRALIQAVAKSGLRQLVPALRRIEVPELVATSWRALGDLDAPPTGEQFAAHLASGDPKMRAAAVRELVHQGRKDAIPRATQIALGDADRAVRQAAVEALGATRSPNVLPSLERIFDQPSWDLRQAAARAITGIGGRDAAKSLARLVFTAPPDAQRYAVLALMVSGVKRDDPLLKHIREAHPNAAIRRIAERGLEVRRHH